MSLGKTKEFYNLLRAQFIKEISEDHEISKILSSDTIEKLEKVFRYLPIIPIALATKARAIRSLSPSSQ